MEKVKHNPVSSFVGKRFVNTGKVVPGLSTPFMREEFKVISFINSRKPIVCPRPPYKCTTREERQFCPVLEYIYQYEHGSFERYQCEFQQLLDLHIIQEVKTNAE